MRSLTKLIAENLLAWQRLVTAICFFSLSIQAQSQIVSDVFFSRLLDNQLPAKIQELVNQPWPGGTYNVYIYRDGMPVFKSTKREIFLQLPLRVEIRGNAQIFGSQLICAADFPSLAKVESVPTFSQGKTLMSSNIDLPIPAVQADCGSFAVPVDALLRQLVAQEKAQWELRLDKALNTEITKLGL